MGSFVDDEDLFSGSTTKSRELALVVEDPEEKLVIVTTQYEPARILFIETVDKRRSVKIQNVSVIAEAPL